MGGSASALPPLREKELGMQKEKSVGVFVNIYKQPYERFRALCTERGMKVAAVLKMFNALFLQNPETWIARCSMYRSADLEYSSKEEMSCRVHMKQEPDVRQMTLDMCKLYSVNVSWLYRTFICFCLDNADFYSMLVEESRPLQTVKKKDFSVDSDSSEDSIRMTLRVPASLKEEFNSYCNDHNISVSCLVTHFIHAAYADTNWATRCVAEAQSNLVCDTIMSLYMKSKERDAIDLVASAVKMKYSAVIRCFMSYCVRNKDFDYTELLVVLDEL